MRWSETFVVGDGNQDTVIVVLPRPMTGLSTFILHTKGGAEGVGDGEGLTPLLLPPPPPPPEGLPPPTAQFWQFVENVCVTTPFTDIVPYDPPAVLYTLVTVLPPLPLLPVDDPAFTILVERPMMSMRAVRDAIYFFIDTETSY